MADDASRKLAGRHSRRVGRRRKLKVDAKAEPKDAAADESRRLGSKAGPEGRSEGASWKVGRKAEPED